MSGEREGGGWGGSGKDRLYLDFFALREAPFSITPDPEFLYFSSTHQAVIDKILYGIGNRSGFILLIGEVGTGKTTLCRSVLDRLEAKAEKVYIINPSVSGMELLYSILDDLGISYGSQSTKKDLIDLLNRFALAAAGKRPVVIIIDDAQTMPLGALEDLRLLSNLETDKEKLLQIVLVGQPELMDLIGRPEIRQLRQRVVIHCHLDLLSVPEVEGYIDRRLFVAGNQGQVRFTPKAKRLIAKVSGGIPRLINTLCDYAMTAAYVAGAATIGHGHVRIAEVEIGGVDGRGAAASRRANTAGRVRRRPWTMAAAGTAMAVAGVLSAALIWRAATGVDAPARTDAAPAVMVASATADLTASAGTPSMPPVTVPPMGAAAPAAVSAPSAPAEGRGDPAAASGQTSFVLQIGSYRTLQRTLRAHRQYLEAGVETHWNRVDLGDDGVWYRLFTGRFDTRTEALAFGSARGLPEAMVVGAPWTVQIAAGASPAGVRDLREALAGRQIDVYDVATAPDRFSVRSGAFVTRDGAGDLAREIAALGYDARVVPR